MPIHSLEEILSDLDEDVHGSVFLPHPLPKYRFPHHETNPQSAYQLVHDELLLDGNSRQNLATFCQTWMEPETQKLMVESVGKNLIDRDEYPQTASYSMIMIGDAETRKRLEQQRESFGKTNIWLLRRIARLIRRNKKLTKNTERVPSTEITALPAPKENDTLRGL